MIWLCLLIIDKRIVYLLEPYRVWNNLISFLSLKLGLRFSGRDNGFVIQKLKSRMAVLSIPSPAEYKTYLETHASEVSFLNGHLAVSVTHFFRNPLVFEYLIEDLLPKIIQRNLLNHDRVLRIWSAGCATGEEAYSLAVACMEVMKRHGFQVNLSIIATDIEETALEVGRKGTYQPASLDNVRYGLINRYFQEHNFGFEVKEEVKSVVHFSNYDLFDPNTYAPPESMFGDFDLVLCRNVLIYYDDQHQMVLTDKLRRATAVNGFLILGEAESLVSAAKGLFTRENSRLPIYRRIK